MAPVKTMFVEYIGNKPQKTDNVLNSGVIWLGKGDIQEIQKSIGEELVRRFPAIWKAGKNPAVKNAKAAKKADDAKPDEIKGVDATIKEVEKLDDNKKIRAYCKKHGFTYGGQPLKETVIKKFRAHLTAQAENQVNARENADSGEPQVVNGVTVEGDLLQLLPLAEAGNFPDDAEEAISQAIEMLGSPLDGFYDNKGLPRQDAIQLLVGEAKATPENIEIVMASRASDENK